MIARRFLESAAMMIIGDSLLCLLSPRRHVSLWMQGPDWWRQGCRPFVRHPGLTRALGLCGLGFGIWLAWRQEPEAQELEFRSMPSRWLGRMQEALR